MRTKARFVLSRKEKGQWERPWNVTLARTTTIGVVCWWTISRQWRNLRHNLVLSACYFFAGATKPGVALKLLTSMPSLVFHTRTSPLAAPPATNWPSGLIATA
jgi:hypothetical protein